MSSSTMRVAEYLRGCGVGTGVVHLDKTTRTAELAAQAIGCPVGAIVKSLVFLADGRPVLVLASGDRRVSTEKLGKLVGAEQVTIARASEVKEITGFAIGGVPPVAHDNIDIVLMDEHLRRFEMVYAAAGSPFDIFPVTPYDLERIAGARVCDVVEDVS